MGSDVAVQMTLTLILNVEGKYMTREILPCRAAVDEVVAVLKDVLNAIFKVRNTIGIPIPKLDVVVTGLAKGAVQRREMVLFNISVISPTAKLVAIMHGDDQFDI